MTIMTWINDQYVLNWILSAIWQVWSLQALVQEWESSLSLVLLLFLTSQFLFKYYSLYSDIFVTLFLKHEYW